MQEDRTINLPKRKSPRISGYDYSSENFYFITICTHEKQCIFGNPGELSWIGKCAEEKLHKISSFYPGIRIDKYVIMPNHVHVIFDVQADKEKSLILAIGQYKAAVTKQVRERISGFCVWQRSFHDHVIRNERSYLKIWEYIENNPLKWEDDCFYIAAQQEKTQREGQ